MTSNLRCSHALGSGYCTEEKKEKEMINEMIVPDR